MSVELKGCEGKPTLAVRIYTLVDRGDSIRDFRDYTPRTKVTSNPVFEGVAVLQGGQLVV